MRVIISIVAGTFAVIALALAIYLGAFKSVELKQTELGPLHLLYVEKMGPYHQVSNTITKVEEWAKAKNFACKVTYGEYLDNPNKMEAERLKAHVGCLISEADKDLVFKTAQTEPKLASGEELHTESRALTTYVQATFAGSPGIGPLKVYPRAEKFIASNKLQLSGPVIETYEVLSAKDMKTTYFFPVITQ